MADSKVDIRLTANADRVSQELKATTTQLKQMEKIIERGLTSRVQAERELAKRDNDRYRIFSDTVVKQKELIGLKRQEYSMAAQEQRLRERTLKTEQSIANTRKSSGSGGGNRAGRFNAAAMNVAYGVDDFVSSTGGVGQRLRGAGNNISAALSFAGPKGLIAGIAINIATQVADAFGAFDKIDEMFNLTSKKQQEAAAELKSAADAQKKAADEASKRQQELFARIADPLQQLSAAQALSPQGRERAARAALRDSVVGNRGEVEADVANAQQTLNERTEELRLLGAGRAQAEREVARAEEAILQDQISQSRASGASGFESIYIANPILERELRVAQEELSRITTAAEQAQGVVAEAELALETAQEPLRRAAAAEGALPGLVEALDLINSIAREAGGADVRGIDSLVRAFDLANELAQAGDLAGAERELEGIRLIGPQVRGDAFSARLDADLQARIAARTETQFGGFMTSAGGRFEDGRLRREIADFLAGARIAVDRGAAREEEIAGLARERFLPGLGLGTDPTLANRAAIGVSDLRSSGSELARLLSGEDSASKLEKVSSEQLEQQKLIVKFLTEQGLALAE